MKLKNIVVLAVILTLSCGVTDYLYESSLISPYEGKPSPNPKYVDATLDITFEFHTMGLGMVVYNKSDEFIKLSWNETYFVRPDGTVAKLLHISEFGNEKWNSRFFSINPSLQNLALSKQIYDCKCKCEKFTVLPPKSMAKFILLTNEKVSKFNTGILPLILPKLKHKIVVTGLLFHENPLINRGRVFRVYMLIETETKKRFYPLEFKVVSFTPVD